MSEKDHKTFQLELDVENKVAKLIFSIPPEGVLQIQNGAPLVIVIPDDLAISMAKNIIIAFGQEVELGQFMFQMGNGGAKA